MSMTRRHLSAAIGFGLGLAVAPYIGDAAAQTKNVTFIQPNPSAINSFQVFIAIGEGYFRDENLNVRVETVDGSAPVLQALAAGQAQIGRPGPAPVLNARARGVDVVFIYNALPKSSFGIAVKRDSRYQQATDLKGKVIGTGTRDGAEVGFARAIFTDLGMKEGTDYTFIPVGDGGPAAAGFLRNDIEAYIAATSDVAILNQRGMPVRDITPEKFKGYFGNGYAAMNDYITKNPDVIEGFGRAMVRASRFVMEPANRTKALAHLEAGNRQEGENKQFAAALLEAVLLKAVPNDASKWGHQNPQDWENWQKSLLAGGDLKQPQDLSKAFTNKFVEAWNKPR